jgi:psp operon transcriptional activator
VRLIAATNEDLPRLAADGRFRLDLLDRLAFDVITLPPLRERPEDIPILAEYFAINMATELGRDYFAGFTDAARKQLDSYAWPGNLRELKNVVERAVYRAENGDAVADIVLDPFDSPYRPPAEAAPAAGHSLPLDIKRTVRELEIELLRKAMSASQFNQRKAAVALGLTYDQLRGYLKKYGQRHIAAG